MTLRPPLLHSLDDSGLWYSSKSWILSGDNNDDDLESTTLLKSLDDYAIPSTTSTRTNEDDYYEDDGYEYDDDIDVNRLLLPRYSLPDLSLLPSPTLLKSRFRGSVLIDAPPLPLEEEDEEDEEEEEDDYFDVRGGTEEEGEEEKETDTGSSVNMLATQLPSRRNLVEKQLSSRRNMNLPKQVSFRHDTNLETQMSSRYTLQKQASIRDNLRKQFSRNSILRVSMTTANAFEAEEHHDSAAAAAAAHRQSIRQSLRQSHAAIASKSMELSSSAPTQFEDIFEQVFHVASSEAGSEDATRKLQKLISQKSMRLGLLAAMEGNEEDDEADADEDMYLEQMEKEEQQETAAKNPHTLPLYKRAPRKGFRGVARQVMQARDLFARHPSLRRLVPGGKNTSPEEVRTVVQRGALQAQLSRAIYHNTEEATAALGHTIVDRGLAGNIAWMVTESTEAWDDFAPHHHHHGESSDVSVLSITFRGFEAQDKSADTEQLCFDVAHAKPTLLTLPESSQDGGDDDDKRTLEGIRVHSGLLKVAHQLYRAISPYVENKRPEQRIILNGHSLGGTSSVLVLLLLTLDKGVDYVRREVLRVYTFGSPSVVMCHDPHANDKDDIDRNHVATTKETTAAISDDATAGSTFNEKGKNGSTERKNIDKEKDRKKKDKKEAEEEKKTVDKDEEFVCPILQTVGLPSSMVFGYIQPWDFFPRLFTRINPGHYCFVDSEGYDLLKSCRKPRFLRPIVTKALRKWPRWLEFRALFLQQGNQRFEPVGIQHLLVPPRRRYVSDRFTRTTSASFPPLRSMQRMAPTQLWTVLEDVYPLDGFRLSKMLVMIRSILHHLNPAYSERLTEFAGRMEKRQGKAKEKTETNLKASPSRWSGSSSGEGRRKRFTTPFQRNNGKG